MAISRQDELYNIVLESLKDGKVHEFNDIRRHVKRNISMTRSEAAKKLPSGRELLWLKPSRMVNKILERSRLNFQTAESALPDYKSRQTSFIK